MTQGRHGCLTAFLVLIVVAHVGMALWYLAVLLGASNLPIEIPAPALAVLIAGGLFNVACAVALFRWRKWGFYGLCVSAVAVFVLNFALGLGAQALLGLLAPLLLYATLVIGGDRQAWPHLK